MGERLHRHGRRRHAPGVGLVTEVPTVGLPQTILQRDPRPPAGPVQLGRVKQLASHAVGLAAVEPEPSAKANDPRDQPGELGDADLSAAADVDRPGTRIMPQEPHTSIGQIVDMEKLPLWCTGPPDADVRSPGQLGVMDLA